MKMFLTICLVAVMAMGVVSSANATLTPIGSAPMTFTGDIQLLTNGAGDVLSQNGVMWDDDNTYKLVISTVASGDPVYWDIQNAAGESKLAGEMLDFDITTFDFITTTTGVSDSTARYLGNPGTGFDGVGTTTGGTWSGSFGGLIDWNGTVNITPEPATMCLLGLGGVMSLISRKRKRA